MERFIYEAKVISVYDADTATLMIDLGCKVTIKEKVRFYGIDTPEIRTRNKREKALGLEARDFVRDLILDKTVIIKTFKDKKGKFGRYLANIYVDDISLNDLLVQKGYAKVYLGGKREKWFT